MKNRTTKGVPFVEYITFIMEVYHGRNHEEKEERGYSESQT